jgi:hypothetical protein
LRSWSVTDSRRASVEISALATAWMVPLLSRGVAGIAQA